MKKKWATYEATKKRNELRHLERLQPLKCALDGLSTFDDDDSSGGNREVDRRKIKPFSVKPLQRKVFSGSRHTRALSLLSPKEPSSLPNLSARSNGPLGARRATVNDVAVPFTVPEMATTEVLPPVSNRASKGPQRDVILETSRQLVGDFRQGLWTFFEDLKQVTVGDEAASTSDARNRPSLQPEHLPTKKAAKDRANAIKERPLVRENVFAETQEESKQQWSEVTDIRRKLDGPIRGHGETIGWPMSTVTDTGHPKDVLMSSSDSDEDGWDNWETPTTKSTAPQRRNHTHESDKMASPLTDKSSLRTSMR